MDILLLLLLAQIVFYIVQHQYIYVIGFIGLSLLVQEYFSQKRTSYLFVPMAIIHIIYCLNIIPNLTILEEGFRRRRRMRKPKRPKKPKSINKAIKKAKPIKRLKKTKIMKTMNEWKDKAINSTIKHENFLKFSSMILDKMLMNSKKEDKEVENTSMEVSTKISTDGAENVNYDPNVDKVILP